MSTELSRPDRSVSVVDLPPLSERLRYVTWFRLSVAGLVIVLNFWGSRFTELAPREVLPATVIFVIAAIVNDFARRILHRRGLPLISAMLLMDGIYLAWVTFATGGPTSPLRFVVYLHLIAVTLLASYRTGLKIALWHSLMFFVAFYAQLAGWVDPFVPIQGTVEQAAASFNRLSVLNVIAFWFVAIGTAAFSAINERELRRNRDDFGRIATFAVELEEVTEPRAVARVTLKRLVANFGGMRGVFVAGRDSLRILAYEGEVPYAQVKANADSLVLHAWRDRRVRLVRQAHASDNPMITALFPQGRGLMIVPLFVEAAPVGAIIIEHGGGVAVIERRVISLIEQFAAYSGLALSNAWAVEEVKRLAQVDPLTGIANRATFQETLAREMSRSERGGDPFSLLLLDIDNFKQVNDTHGHQVGDDVIRGVAYALTSSKRDFDSAARYGGEEFAIILPGCSAQDSRAIADRFRKRVAGITEPVPVTASVGVATFPQDGASAKDIIKAADDALYESKRSGRDRVTVAAELELANLTPAPTAPAPPEKRTTVAPLDL